MTTTDASEATHHLLEESSPVHLVLEDLAIRYRVGGAALHAVDGVGFELTPGDSLGLVGESGCGKTTVLKAILRLLPTNATAEGRILLDSEDVLTMSSSRLRAIRWTKLSLITQSAINSLDPVYRIGDQIVESITAHVDVDTRTARERAAELLQMVGIPADRINDYPHQLSGGMRQRVVIAMALSLNAGLLLADEPTTALDSITQDQVLSAIQALQRQHHRSMILVTHDMAVVAETCDRLVVMYAGRVMESGPTTAVLMNPFHPYTMGLRNAFPIMQDQGRDLISIPGNVPGLLDPPPGCRFASRCPFRTEKCVTVDPPLIEVGPDHRSACHYPDQAEIFRARAQQHATWREEHTVGDEWGTR